MMLRKRIAIVALASVLIGAAVLGSKVRVVEQWGLYTSTGPKQPLRLFLDPFPAESFCRSDANAVMRDGGRAECRRELALTLDPERSKRFFWEFVAEWAQVCGPQQVAARTVRR